MDFKKSKKLLILIIILYWVFVSLIYIVAGNQFKYTLKESNAPNTANSSTSDIFDGVTVTQELKAPMNSIESVAINAWCNGNNSGLLHVTVCDVNKNIIAATDVDTSLLNNTGYVAFDFTENKKIEPNERLILTLTTSGCSQENAIHIYTGSEITAGRFDVVQDISNELYTIDNQSFPGMLCIKLIGVRELNFYKIYWYIVIGTFAFFTLCCFIWWKEAKIGKSNPLVLICTVCTKYGFLIHKLVSRDFKTKYKRSVLGMAWSFLNPLLTMAVQYIVFSTLFKSDIPNYPVYLLSGIVFFNFFNEAVTMCMTSITSNASLIKKVYIPKYIFPISKIISSLINFGLAIIPLFLVMLLTGIEFKFSLILLVFDILCLLAFILGMGLLLTTAMTFFQDTQFLWGIITMMWTYLTPMFYPESIIPARFLTLYHMNPMYQYITFARICIIDGISPEPMSYLWCVISSSIILILGIIVFKKNQDKFIMYL